MSYLASTVLYTFSGNIPFTEMEEFTLWLQDNGYIVNGGITTKLYRLDFGKHVTKINLPFGNDTHSCCPVTVETSDATLATALRLRWATEG